MKDRVQKKRLLAAVALGLFFALGGIVVAISAYQKSTHIRNAGYVMISQINKLQYAIDDRLFATQTLEAIVVNDSGNVKNFDAIAENLYTKDRAFRSLQLAPDGVVTFVYPIEGNEDAFGSLFDDPDRKTEAEYARDTGTMTLAGPFELAQGGVGLVARNPIYLPDQSGKQHFWGFSIVVLNLDGLLESVDLDALDGQGYHYKIWKIHPDTGEEQIIAQNAAFSVKKAIVDEIQVPNGTWMLAIMPKEGWVPLSSIAVEGAAALVILVLVLLVLNGWITNARQRAELARQATTDALTGLYNGRSFAQHLKDDLRGGNPCTVYYLDIDGFKQVNDRYGHNVGDEFLVEFAARIRPCLREQDLAFRIGGDEFAILAAGAHTEEFDQNFKRELKQAIEQPYPLPDVTLQPRVSIGFSRYPEEQRDMEGLIRQADERMYREKKAQ